MPIDEKTLKELLKDAPDHYKYISLSIDHAICRLGECRLCIDKCPTTAFYQKDRVELIPELCVGCGICQYRCYTTYVAQRSELDASAIVVSAENEHRLTRFPSDPDQLPSPGP